MTDTIANAPDFMDTETASKLMGVKTTTLHVWNSNGGGPHRITGVKKNAQNLLEWPKTEVLRVAAERGRLTLVTAS